MNFPSHDLAAEDVRDQVEVKKHACDGPGQPGYILGPDFAGPTGLVTGWGLAPDRRFGPTLVVLLTICPQDAIEAGFRCQIPPLIGQFGDDLAWRKAGKLH